MALGSGPIYAVQNEELSSASCVASKIKQTNDSLYLFLDFNLNRSLSSNESVEITPWLADSNHTVILPSLIICGKNQYKLQKRSYELMQKRMKLKFSQQVKEIRLSSPETNHEKYEETIAFEDWMNQASLQISYHACHCGNKNEKAIGRIESIGQLIANDTNTIPKSPIESPEELVELSLAKQQTDTTFHIFKDSMLYQKGVSLPDMNFANNAQIWDSAIELLERNVRKEIIITGIEIDGYASPEGSYQFNEELSKKRANEFREKLTEIVGLPEEMIRLNYHGEDWRGLISLLLQSDLKYKNKILEVIRNKGIFNGREKDLMLLDQGKPYLEIQKELFPFLRKVCIKINYKTTTNK